MSKARIKIADPGEQVDPSDLSTEEILNSTANIYNPSDYDSIVETFNPKDDKNTDLWGSFEPTRYQYEWIKHFTQRGPDGQFLKNLEGVAVCHRRFGKSVGVLKGIFLQWMMEQRGLYLHAFPSLTQGRTAIWNGIGKTTRNPEEQAINYLELFPRELWKKKNNHAQKNRKN